MLELNQEQKLAAQHSSERLLVLAGPGTGKTSALIGRYLHLLENGVPSEKILCCSFSKKAAEEIKTRVKKETDVNIENGNLTTFHALGNKIVKEYAHLINISPPTKILSLHSQRVAVVNKIRKEKADILKETTAEKIIYCGDILGQIDIFRQNLLDPEDAAIKASEKSDVLFEISSRVYEHYEKFLSDNNEIDFERMIQLSTKILDIDSSGDKSFVSKFDHVLVDEFQDINYSQKVMIDHILKGGANYWVVGDDDQAIYGWRGSDVKFILGFENDYPGAAKVNLVKNYRSGSSIVLMAKQMAQHLTSRHIKELNAVKSEQGQVKKFNFANEYTEADEIVEIIKSQKKEGLKNKDIAVLARTNELPAAVASKLALANIPYFTKDGSGMFSDRFSKQLLNALAESEGKSLHKKWATKFNPQLASFAKALKDDPWKKKVTSLSTYILNRVPDGMSEDDVLAAKETVEIHKKYFLGKENPEEIFRDLNAQAEGDETSDAVYLGTIHGAKGLEWESVFIIGWEESILPHSLAIDRLDEERRLAYVGLTRAKQNLFMTYVDKRKGKEKVPSFFLTDLFLAPAAQILGDNENWPDDKLAKVSDRTPEDIKADLTRLIDESVKARNDAAYEFDAAEGLLSYVGYSASKNGPSDQRRQMILADVFYDSIEYPEFLKASVLLQWGKPKSPERFKKLRNSLNSFKSLNEGKTNKSQQAIEKWEKDIEYLDNVLAESVENDDET